VPNKSSLKSLASKGIFWSAVEKFSVQGSQFIIAIILARLLVPADFGLIGMLAIFIAIAQTFVDGGMGLGLVQRKKRTRHDFSTVFVFNFVVSCFFYVLLFITAPYIADFYETPALINVTRVIGLNIIIGSLAIVQRTKLTIDLDFKTLAKVNIIAVILSGICSIYLAYTGSGVWSLVYRQLISSTVTVLLLWYFSRWKASLFFSLKSFKDLFGYGSKILAAGVYAKVFQNIYNIAIGKAYSAGILQQVTFPILATLQEDQDRMISVYKRLIRMTAFLIFPTMTILAVLAEPLVILFIGEKWLPTVPLLQWFCFSRVWSPIGGLNLNVLNANGRSDLFLKVDLSKAPIVIVVLIITIPMGIEAMVIGQVISSFISFFINAYMPGKLYGYGAFSQIKDIWPMIVASAITAFFTYLSITITDILFLKLILGGITAIISYFGICYVFKIQELYEIKILLLKLRKKQLK
jgi:teichuronic acid exporter